jgi:hypothetical protein
MSTLGNPEKKPRLREEDTDCIYGPDCTKKDRTDDKRCKRRHTEPRNEEAIRRIHQAFQRSHVSRPSAPGPSVLPTYAQLQAENLDLKVKVAALEGEIKGLRERFGGEK